MYIGMILGYPNIQMVHDTKYSNEPMKSERENKILISQTANMHII